MTDRTDIVPYVARHEPLLGTVVEFRIRAHDESSARAADARMVAEIERLAGVFSMYDADSELSRWKRGDCEPGGELADLLVDSLAWQARSGGAYNPAVGVLTERWRRAAIEDRVPDDGELADLAATIAEPPYRLVDGRVLRVADVSALSFNAMAKGRVADLAARAGLGVDGVVGLTVNAGGDLVHHGPRPIAVGIEDPARPYDNVPPLVVIDLPGGGLATSGSARRGVRVAGRWFGHVIDPRTGRPVDVARSVSVIAPDAATADVVATVVGVLGPTDGAEFVRSAPDLGCLIVGADGTTWSDPRWDACERPGGRRVRSS